MPGSGYGEFRAEHCRDRKLPKCVLHLGGMALVSRALQDLQKDKVAYQDPVEAFKRAQLVHGYALMIAQVSDPNRRIDNDQEIGRP